MHWPSVCAGGLTLDATRASAYALMMQLFFGHYRCIYNYSARFLVCRPMRELSHARSCVLGGAMERAQIRDRALTPQL